MDQKDEAAPPSRYMAMFEAFRDQLDEHQDRRERVIKASRDITAASKKMIFALQRVRTLSKPLPESIAKAASNHEAGVQPQFDSASQDLNQSTLFYRYSQQITSGIQEYLEAVLFQHYLTTQTLLSYSDAARYLQSRAAHLILTPEDYILAVFDFTGELMRFSITSIATTGTLPAGGAEGAGADGSGDPGGAGRGRTPLTDLQLLREMLAVLHPDFRSDARFAKEVVGKSQVMHASVEKVERAMYGMVVRGSERPKGWVPDLDEGAGRPGEEAY